MGNCWMWTFVCTTTKHSKFVMEQVLAGDVEPAVRTHKAFFAVWKRYGFTPEGFNLATSSVQVREWVALVLQYAGGTSQKKCLTDNVL